MLIMNKAILEAPRALNGELTGKDVFFPEVQERVDRLQQETLKSFQQGIVAPTSLVSGVSRDYLRLIDFNDDNEVAPQNAVIALMPFGNPYNESTHIRTNAISSLLPAQTRILLFPNNTINDKYYTFDNKESQHDALDTLSNCILEACVRLGVDNVLLAGYSQGASVGAKFASNASGYDINVSGMVLGDPANVYSRSAGELRKDFTSTGIGQLNRAINDSGIGALSKVQHSRGGFDSIAQLALLAKAGMSSLIKENKELHKAMGGDSFVSDVEFASSQYPDLRDDRLQIARMCLSKIALPNLVTDIENSTSLGPLRLYEVTGYGHEGGDNVIDWALRVREVAESSNFANS